MTISSDKNLKRFGLIWALIFLFGAFYPSFSLKGIKYWFLFISLSFLVSSLAYPKALKFFYISWLKFGNVIGFINSSIIMFFTFYLLITPTSLILKLLHRDFLEKKISSRGPSYWKDKKQPSSMKYQF